MKSGSPILMSQELLEKVGMTKEQVSEINNMENEIELLNKLGGGGEIPKA